MKSNDILILYDHKKLSLNMEKYLINRSLRVEKRLKVIYTQI